MLLLNKFLELFPNAKIEYGVPLPFPCELDTTLFPAWQEECDRAVDGDCLECAQRFWSQEVE